jgi:hypothetical protein
MGQRHVLGWVDHELRDYVRRAPNVGEQAQQSVEAFARVDIDLERAIADRDRSTQPALRSFGLSRECWIFALLLQPSSEFGERRLALHRVELAPPPLDRPVFDVEVGMVRQPGGHLKNIVDGNGRLDQNSRVLVGVDQLGLRVAHLGDVFQ